VTGTGDLSRPRAALPALCATQITRWGIVHYAFPVLNPQITAATGRSSTATAGAFSEALLVSTEGGNQASTTGAVADAALVKRGRDAAPTARRPTMPIWTYSTPAKAWATLCGARAR